MPIVCEIDDREGMDNGLTSILLKGFKEGVVIDMVANSTKNYLSKLGLAKNVIPSKE